MIRALIIDDERLAREEMRLLLAAHPQVQIAGEAATLSAAQKLIAQERPDVLFLDINLRGPSGFDLLESLPSPHPQVIFCTAHDDAAMRAFEVNALDYLLKPVHPERLARALARLSGVPVESGGEPALARLTAGSRVFVREGERCWLVAVASISLIEAEGNYSRLHFDGAAPLLYRSLASLEERLPADFLRVNRSQIVNTTFIESVEPWFSHTLKARLRDGTEIEFSRRASAEFRERLAL